MNDDGISFKKEEEKKGDGKQGTKKNGGIFFF